METTKYNPFSRSFNLLETSNNHRLRLMKSQEGLRRFLTDQWRNLTTIFLEPDPLHQGSRFIWSLAPFPSQMAVNSPLQGTPLDSLLCFACQCLLWIRWGISKIGDITQIIHVKSIFYSKPSIHSGTPMTMLNLPCPAQRHRHARRPLRRQWHWLWTVKVSIVVLSNRQKQWSCMTVYPQGDLI